MAGEQAEPISVLIVGAVDMYLDGLALLLEAEGPFSTEVVQGPDADTPALIRRRATAIALVELWTEDGAFDAAATAAAIHAAAPDTEIVAILPHADPILARDVMQAGVRACIMRAARRRILLDAVWHAHRGEDYIDSTLAVALAGLGAQNGAADLTLREKEVLRLIAHGYTNQEIAAQIHLSVRTVETHRAHLQHKLGTARRSDLVRVAGQLGLVS